MLFILLFIILICFIILIMKGLVYRMKWFDKLERKFGRYAIHNLMYYVIGIYTLGFVIDMFAPQVYNTYLALDVPMILKGQIWRIFTYIIQPPSSSIIFMVFTMYFYYLIGMTLENIWGAFKFNMYYFSGVLLHVIAAFLLYFIFGLNFNMTTHYINLALFMAFAVENADVEVLLFFILPIKIKWLALLDGIIFVVTIVGGYAYQLIFALSPNFYMALLSNGIVLHPVYATCALVSMINFIIFYIISKKPRARTQTQKNYRKAYKTAQKAQKKRQQEEEQRRAYMNKQFMQGGMKGEAPYSNNNAQGGAYGGNAQGGAPHEGNAQGGSVYGENMQGSAQDNASMRHRRAYSLVGGAAKHRCAVCGRTENDGDDLVFRYCSKCEGDREYCQDHLYTHVHVTSGNGNNN